MNPYPENGSSHFTPEESDSTKELKQEERDRSAMASPFIKDTLAWFDEQIKDFDSISKALYEGEARGLTSKEILNVLNICKEKFKEKRDDYRVLNENIKKQ